MLFTGKKVKKEKPTAITRESFKEDYKKQVIMEVEIANVTTTKVMNTIADLSQWKYFFPELDVVDMNGNPFVEGTVISEGMEYQVKQKTEKNYDSYKVISLTDSSMYVEQTSKGAFFTNMCYTWKVEVANEKVKVTQDMHYSLVSDNSILRYLVHPDHLIKTILTKSLSKLRRAVTDIESFKLDEQLSPKVIIKGDKELSLTHEFNLSIADFKLNFQTALVDEEKCKTIFSRCKEMRGGHVVLELPGIYKDVEIEFKLIANDQEITLKSIKDSSYNVTISFELTSLTENTTQCTMALKYGFGGYGIWNAAANKIPQVNDSVRGFMVTTMRKMVQELQIPAVTNTAVNAATTTTTTTTTTTYVSPGM